MIGGAAPLTEIERRIVEAVSRARRDGLEPKSVYLTPDDLAALEDRGPVDQCGGLPIKRVSGRGRSRIYCRHGIARALRVKAEARR